MSEGFNKKVSFKNMKLVQVKEIDGDPNVYLIYKSLDPEDSKIIMLKQRHINQQEFDNYDAANAVIDFAKTGKSL